MLFQPEAVGQERFEHRRELRSGDTARCLGFDVVLALVQPPWPDHLPQLETVRLRDQPPQRRVSAVTRQA